MARGKNRYSQIIVSGMGQVETDELYVGLDQRGAQYVIPIQAKGGADKLGIIQIEQDFAMCAAKFPALICRPIAAQFFEENSIALFSFEEGELGSRFRLKSTTAWLLLKKRHRKI